MAQQNKDNLDLGKEKAGGSPRILLYVVITLIVVVLGMGGALLYVMGVFGGKPHAASKTAPATHEKAAEAAPKVPIYISLDKDLVVNLPANSEARLMQVGVVVLAYDPGVQEVLKKHMPMLRNNINLLLAGQDSAVLMKQEGKQALQAQVLAEVNKIIQMQMPGVTAEQIFFTNFILQ